VIGNMVGAGIFTLPAALSGEAGPASIVAPVFTGVGAMLLLLLPLLAFIALLTRDRSLIGKYAAGRAWTVVIVGVTLMIAAATVVLGVVLVGG
jgi:hypothetical protein